MDFEKEFEELLNRCDPVQILAHGTDRIQEQLTKMMTEIERLQEVERKYLAASK